MGNQQGSPSSRNKQFLRDVNLPGKIPERLPEKENTDTLSDTTNKEGSSVDVQSDNLDGQRETVLIGSSLGLPGEKCTQSIEKAAKEYIPSSVGETVNHIRCDAKKEVELEHKDDHADESSQVENDVPSYECNQTVNTEHVLSDHQTLLSISPHIETEECIREMLGVSDAENATSGRFSMEHKTITEQVDSKSVSEHTRNVFRVDSDKGAGSVEALSMEFINGDPGSQKDNNGLNSEPNQGADADDENSDDEDYVDDDEPNTAPVSPLSPNTKFSEEQEMGRITCETKTGPSLPEIPLVATVGVVKMSVDSSKLMSQHHEAGVYKRKCTFVGDDNRTQCQSDQNGHLSGNGMTYGIYSNMMFLPEKSEGAAPKRYGPKKLGATMPAMEDVDGECDEPPSEVSELDGLKTDPHVDDISNSSFVLKDEPPFQGKHGSDLCIKPASSLTAHEHDSSEECEANRHNHGDYRNTASFPTFGKNCKFNIDWNILKSKQGQFAKNLKSCCSNIAEDNRISLEFSLPFYHGKIEIGGEMTTFNFSEPLSKTERLLSCSIGSHPGVIENNLDISSDEEMCEPEKVSVHYETVDTCSIKPDLKKCFQDLSTYQTLQNHVHDQFEPGTGLKTAFDEINAVCSKPPPKQVEVGNVNDKETHDEAENDALEMATSKLFKDANGLSEVGVNKLTNSQAFVLDTYGSETATANNNSNVDIDSTTTSLNTSSSSFSNGNLERNGRLKAAPKNNTYTLSVSESDIPALAEIQGNKDGNDRQISMGQCDIERNSVEKTEDKDVDRDTESAIAYEDERTSRLEKSNLLNGNQDKSHVDFKDQQGDDDSSSHDKSGETKNDIDLSGSDDHGMNTYTSIFKRKQTNKDQDNRLVKIDSDDEDNIRVPQAQMQDDSHNSIREPSNKIPGFPDDIMSTSDESLKIDEIRKRQRNRRMERKMAKLLHESVDTETLERTERHRPRDGPSNKGRIVNKNQHRGVASGEDDNHEEANALGGISQITDDFRSMFDIDFTLEPNEFHRQLERKMPFRRYRDVVKSERREPTKLRHPDGTKRRPVNKNISGPKHVSRLQSSDTVNVEEDKTNRDDEPAFFDTEEDFSDESSVMSNSDVEKEEGPLAELDEANWDAVFKLETVKSRRTIETPAQYRCTVLCIDISESMQGDPWLQVKDALQVFLKGIEDVKSRFGTAELVSMVTFGHETKMALTPTTDYSQVMTTFDRLEVRGNTPLQPGLFLALFPVIVTANNRHDYNAYGQKVRHRVILFTDCHPTPYKVLSDNDSVTESQSIVAVKEVVERMKNLNSQGLRNMMNIHCVPIGENPNLVLMEVIAKKSGGQIVPLTDIERLSTSTHNYLKALHITRHILDCGTDRLDEKLLTSIITTLFPDVGTEDMVQIKSEIRFEFKKNKRQNKDKPKKFSGMEDDAGAKDTDSDEDSDEETNSNGNEHDSFTEVEGMPAIGTRVKRGPDFDPDEIVVVSERGTITGHSVRKKKCVFVHWDCGIKTYCHYGEKNKYDVVVDDAAHIPSKIKDTIKVGHKVRRGPNWQYGNQDGGSDKLGTVYDVDDNGVKVQVRWENGNTGHYRYNYDGAYDVLISCQNDPFDVQRYTHEMNRRNLAKLRGIDINSAVHYRHEKLDIDLSESLIGLDLDKPKKGQGRTNKNAVCYQNMNHVDYASTGAIPKKIKVPFKYS